MNTWFSIRAEADSQGHDAVVAIRDFIGVGTGAADEFVAALDASKAKRPLIEINSRGGSVLDSVAIYAAIASLDATVRIRGLALSAASYIASAAKRVEIVANGWLMLHAPRTEAGGTASELGDVAKQLAAFEADYRSAYMRKSGKDEATVSAWLSKDTWMNAKDALAAGLVNVILPAASFEASADVAAMNGAPEALRALVAVDQTAPEAARNAFRKGIQQSEDGLAGDGLEPATVKEARSLAAGERPTEAKVRKANAWWGRNERFLEAEANTPADVAANLWGGAAGRDWFRDLFNELESEQASIRAAAPGDLAPEDYVELSYGNGRTKGEVVEVVTSGTVSGSDGSVEASADDPAALIDVLREVGTTGDFEETDVQVARLFSTLTKVEPPRIVEVEDEAQAKISASTNAGNQNKPMNKTAKLLAMLGVQPAAEDTFLASAIADLGVTPEAVSEARKSGSTDFLATHIKDRIAAADATAKAATDRANAILAAVGVKADAPDIAAEVAKAIEAKAAALASEQLAKRGYNPKALAAANKGNSNAKPLSKLELAMAAHRQMTNRN